MTGMPYIPLFWSRILLFFVVFGLFRLFLLFLLVLRKNQEFCTEDRLPKDPKTRIWQALLGLRTRTLRLGPRGERAVNCVWDLWLGSAGPGGRGTR